MICQLAMPFLSFFVAVGLVPAVYFFFDDGIANNHVSKIDNVTWLGDNENGFSDVEDGETAEGRDILVMIIGAFCRMCLSGEIKFCLHFSLKWF